MDEVLEQALSDLNGTLRPYQLEFLTTKYKPYPHVATFDEMGIGKTPELIALDAVRRRQAGPGNHKTLVVAPLTGVIDQWVEHFNEWRPDLRVRRINAKSAKTRAWFLQDIDKADVFVIHPAGLRIMADELAEIKWLHFIFDEVHAIKNRKTKTTKAAKLVGKQSTYRSGGSGTPIENRSDEAWSIFVWLYPDKKTRGECGLDKWTQKLLASYWRFYARYVDYYEDDFGYHHIQGTRNEDEFKKLFGPFYIRRLKKEVMKHLPPKQYQRYEVELLPRQRRAYDEMKKELLAWIGENEDQPVVAPVAIAQLIRLQQFALGYGSIENVKVNKNDGTVEIKQQLRLEEPSIKLDVLMDILDDLGDAQAIVFSTSKQAINMAYQRLMKADIPASIITGDIMQNRRKGEIKLFQNGDTKVLVATIRAGGVGMNLQNASNVIFLDRDWSPSKNTQAEDRSHRDGQKLPVNIIDIVAKDTVDKKKHDTIQQKWEWIRDTIGA